MTIPLSTIFAIGFIVVVATACWWFLFKRKKPQTAPFPKDWRTILLEKVDFYQQLWAAEKIRFEESVQHFLDEVSITGVGTAVNDTDRMLVAASAVIPLFGFPGWKYRKLTEVLLYDGAFNRDYETSVGEERNILGLVGGEGMTGTMILSKPALYHGFDNPNSTQHVGIHEFVHLLDRADGSTDGVPEALLEKPFIIPWVKMMHQEIQAIHEGESDINDYGSTNQAEFFSVVSEYFFKQPRLLEKRHPELFALLEKVFRK